MVGNEDGLIGTELPCESKVNIFLPRTAGKIPASNHLQTLKAPHCVEKSSSNEDSRRPVPLEERASSFVEPPASMREGAWELSNLSSFLEATCFLDSTQWT